MLRKIYIVLMIIQLFIFFMYTSHIQNTIPRLKIIQYKEMHTTDVYHTTVVNNSLKFSLLN